MFLILKEMFSVSAMGKKVCVYDKIGWLLIPVNSSQLAIAKPVSPFIASLWISVFPLYFKGTFLKDVRTLNFQKLKGNVVCQTRVVNLGGFSDPAVCLLTDHE